MQKNNQYHFTVYQVNIANAVQQLPALTQLQTLLIDFRTHQQRMIQAGDVRFGNVALPATYSAKRVQTLMGSQSPPVISLTPLGLPDYVFSPHNE